MSVVAVRVPRPADTVGLRLAALGLAVVVAYHYSLLTLARDLDLDTPLAYLGLVPLMAVGIAWLAPRPTGPEIHDRQVDLIVGLPLVAGALFAQWVLPGRLGTRFWLDRVDLLTLPVFVAGCVTLLFGVRALWRFRLPVAFLLLTWPVPYAWFIEHFLGLTTGTTLAGIRRALHVVHAATPVPGGDGSLFTIVHAGVPYQVDVASSCSGVNSLVGFALVGAAFAAVVQGGRVRKAVWLGLGLLLVWSLNVVRIVAIFWAGRAWGERFAVDGLHPVLGLVVFAVGVLVMVAVMPLFRLGIGAATAAPTAPPTGALTGAPAAPPRAPVAVRDRLRAAPRGAGGMRLAGASLVAGALVLFSLDGGLSRFELTANDFGAARVVAFDAQPASVTGFSAAPIATYDWVDRFFGPGSSWHRLEYTAALGTPGAPGALAGAAGAAGTAGARGAAELTAAGAQPVIADVIDSKAIDPFNAYGIEACYSFHGYQVHGEHAVNLGGVEGQALTYRDGANAWNVVYWIWVVDDGAGNRRYERVVLLQSTDGGGGTAAQPDASPLQGVGYGTASGAAAAPSTDPGVAALVAFAKQAVAHAVPVPVRGATVSASR